MINEQLNRILSSNLEQIDDHLFANEEKLGSLEDFLSAKAKELGGLQRCFMQELEEIKQYEESKVLVRKFITELKGELEGLRKGLLGLAEYHTSLLQWKSEVENSFGDLVSIVKVTVRREEAKRLEAMRELNEQHLDTLKILQTKHEDDVDKLRKAILYLEKEMKKKNGDTIVKTEILEGQPHPLASRSNTRSYLQMRQSEHSVSPKHYQPYFQCSTPKGKKSFTPVIENTTSANRQNQISPTASAYRQIVNGDQKTSKTRSSVLYKKNFEEKRMNSRPDKERQEKPVLTSSKHNLSYCNNNTSNSSSFVRISDSFKRTIVSQGLVVPDLPQLVLNITYTPPIYNGFDVLIQKNKEVYKGMWKRGVFEGRGKFYSDSWVYDGQFKNGMIDGLGSLSFGGCTFIGKFVNGRANGEATLYTRERPISGVWKDHELVRQV